MPDPTLTWRGRIRVRITGSRVSALGVVSNLELGLGRKVRIRDAILEGLCINFVS